MHEPRLVGLRAQLAVALAAVLALTAAVALAAVEPLSRASAHHARMRHGLVLARAVAGQVASTPDLEAARRVLGGSVGDGALKAAALLDPNGRLSARAGHFTLRQLILAPPRDGIWTVGDRLAVVVWIPPRGTFVAECSLAPSAAERAAPRLLLLYSSSAGLLAVAVVYLLLTRWIVRPVEGLTRAAERVAEGRRDVRAEERGSAEVVRAAAAFNRMTDQLRSREAELSDRVAELETATRELRAAEHQVVRHERLATVGRLSAGIAHEVGNPLAAIVGLADVLREGGLEDAEVVEFAGRIGHEARRIHRTVRELLDYARTSPSIRPPPLPPGDEAEAPEDGSDLREAVDQVSRLLSPQRAYRDLVVRSEIAPDLPRLALSPDRLVQVLLNLCINAGDALRSVGRQAGQVTVRARVAAEGELRVDVEDDGPGIPEGLQGKVFEPFFSTKAAGEGTGLGLAICASLAEQVGGRIEVGGRVDGAPGARFTLWLPAAGG